MRVNSKSNLIDLMASRAKRERTRKRGLSLDHGWINIFLYEVFENKINESKIMGEIPDSAEIWHDSLDWVK